MIKIVRYTFLSLMALLFSLSACEDESLNRIPDINANVGAITKIEVNPDKTFFNALNNLANEEIEFTIDVDGFEITEVETVDIELVFTEKDGTTDLEGNPADLEYSEVFVKTVNTFPTTISVTGQECADALGVDISSFKVGDGFNLLFPINTKDGRKLKVALESDLCQEPVQPSFGGCNVKWAISCPSDESLYVKTYDSYTTAATPFGNWEGPEVVTITTVSPGVYSIDRVLGGMYAGFYGDAYEDGTLRDVCLDLSIDSFGDQYGETVTVTNVLRDDVTGVITYDWSTTFGETGSTTLTPQ